MSEPEALASGAPSPAATSSPLAPAALFRLLFRPRAFFADVAWLDRKPELVVVAWLAGVASAMDRVDKNILRAELSRARPELEHTTALLLNSWPLYWTSVLLGGTAGALIVWYVGGWWYKKRLQWSGASDVSPFLARRVNAYQSLVIAGPVVLVTVLQTFAFANYRAAWEAEELWSSLAAIFPFWSCWTSFVAATTVFGAARRKALFWFAGLPVLFCLGFVGGVAALFAQRG